MDDQTRNNLLKVCTVCSIEKPLTDFHRRLKIYRRSSCKSCAKKKQREQFLNPEFRRRHNDRQKIRQRGCELSENPVALDDGTLDFLMGGSL